MERIVWTCCLLLLLGFAAGFRTIRSVNSTSDDRILSYIKQHIDESADPCEDFQNYATGKFLEVHQKEDCNSTQDSIRKKYNGKLQSVFNLLKDRVFIDEFSVEEKVWRYYNTCLTAPKSTRSARHYLELLPPGYNLPWPPLVPQGSQWPKQEFRWLETLAILRRFGEENPLIILDIQQNFWESHKFSLRFNMPQLLKLDNVTEIQDLLIRTGVNSRRAAPLARSIIQLDSDAHNLSKIGERLAVTYILEDVQNRTNLQLDKYLEMVFGRSFEPSTEVLVDNMEYLEGINGVVSKYDSEVVASYLMIQFLRFVFYLDDSDSESDTAKCAAVVSSQMELASDLLYENYYLGEGKLQKYTKEVQRIFEAVSQTFMARLEKNRLHLTDGEVSYLQQKLLAMRLKVGKLPDNANHRRFATKFYEDLELHPFGDFAEARLNVLRHRTSQYLDQLDWAVPKGTDFYLLTGYMPENDPKPVFFELHNTILLPYDMLQEPFFSPETSDVFKMSQLGFSLARSMMESFWPFGLRYDSLGNLGDNLLSFKEKQGYIDGLACLNFTTRSKDLLKRSADVVSLGLVYDTFFGDNSKFNQDQPAFTELPLKKLFLLSFAQMFAGNQEYKDFEEMDSDKLRLSEALSNLPAFGEIFNCPDSAPLNRPKKCEIW
ncbi:membrane metallo-endopeptidase-like 1 [Drosophila rhopaloa]|uniref:Membrane metallo-endopeptidase-like 1 n=1 Tax=Drosophila rhopaloa TaxID=1041015 RepID=A0ABM5JBR4_DRORH|nr:membrane metallo-endopeptidase-like 1 [Drosophila rhopaloa]